jgi:glycosyltransferase involved in cell wall biosynthesis
VIEDGVTGCLVPPGDAAALAKRIIAALSDPAATSCWASLGRDRVAQCFSFRAQAKLYRDLFERLTPQEPATDIAAVGASQPSDVW